MANVEIKQESVWLSTQHNEPIMFPVGRQVDPDGRSTWPKKGRMLFSPTHR